ncbi:ATP-binding cassette sub-family C member 8-like isoform X2 [Acanthaster planci]|uniref:ATP-binding cassette sub-family C member 8-like isoform X2 n=1 Tax=Acanthaster planci TaxID=133434 RepID=A0A8B7XLW6_ACAPL|nr:ATP-binding cassette sub-family C member 8-like isoform X2 [Acanthaster planci]
MQLEYHPENIHRVGMDQVLGKFNWYCGVNNTETLDNLTFDLNHTLYNACFVDLAYTLPHLIFIVLGVLVLFILGCCTRIRKERHWYLIQYPGHNCRWVINFIFFSLLLCQIAEGILNELEVYNGQPTRPHLYVPAVLVFVGTILAMFYYNQMETWNRRHMAWLLLVYWALALGGEVTRLLNFLHDLGVDLTILRVDLNLAAIAIYSLFLLLELNVIRVKIFKCCCEEEKFPEDLKKDDMHYLQGYTSLLSSAFYWWLNWIFKKGYKQALEMSDLGSLSEIHTTKYQRDTFTRALKKEQERAKANKTSLSLYRVYARAFGFRILVGGFVKFFGDAATFIPPLALAGAINYVTKIFYKTPEEEYIRGEYVSVQEFLSNGFVLIIIMFWSNIVKLLSQQGHYHIVITESAHLKSSMQAAIYDKSLRLSSYTISGGSMTMGQITNHMSVDTTNILNSTQWVHYIWSIPFLIIGYMVILYFELGVASLIGCVVFFITIPIQAVIARQTAKYQKAIMEKSDERLKRTNELLQGIKLIKLYGWEDMFYTAIKKVRGLEILNMMKAMGWRILLTTITSASPLMVTLVSYGLYTKLTGLPLTSGVAFAALSVFNQMSLPLFLMPMVFVMHINAVVSTKRLQAFFEAAEIETLELDEGDTEIEAGKGLINEKVAVRQPKRHRAEDRQRLLSSMEDEEDGVMEGIHSVSRSPVHPSIPDNLAIRIQGDYTWDQTASTPTIRNIDLDIPVGKLTMVVGQVGSGKSSLLSAILGEMTTVSGRVQWNRKYNSVAYGAQKAWLLNASLKENVLFGNQLENDRYKRVIAACSLQPDIDILPGGDKTEIGEKGINLSGGQKQRVSVGRAMYSYNEVVILDDPLSALDMHVGSHLFKEGIEDYLMKKSKRTVILVTHQLQYADKADKIVYMKDGQIQHQGTLEEIREENPELVANWTATANEAMEESESEGEEQVKEERAKLVRQVSSIMEEEKKAELARSESTAGKLVEKEERAEGSVSWRVYLVYIRHLGFGVFFFQLLLLMGRNGLSIGTNYWLAAWSEHGNTLNISQNGTEDPLLGYYLGGYAGLSVANIIIGAAASTVLYIGSLIAAKKLHNSMLNTIISAPLRFFDTTPIGRVLNRFSSDTAVIDMQLGGTLLTFLSFSLNCISAVLVDAIVTWYFVIALIPIFFLYILLMKVFITTSRELQRLDSISKSPVYAHFSESLGGLSTIRAYKQQQRFQKLLVKKIESSNLTFLYLNTGNRWLGSRLDLIGASIVLFAGLATMVTALTGGSLQPSLVGLAITYALSISSQLNWVIRMSANLEMQMNAMERVEYYKSVKKEDYDGLLEPGSDWPDRGEILYKGVSARYATELEPVLHDIDIHFRAGEKVGICGRTGSGKSSLTLTLFRIIQTFRGQILIDGMNIAHLPLVEVRRRLAIIPQDPVLFTGTIRFNLDARGEHDDNALWEALKIAQLKDVVSDLDLKLDAMVTEGGENFSVGQRQLFCLARAFLRKTRILVMDEATASIDLETDAILQDVVASAFKERTVLTIAHRVQTILDSDHILVLNEGRIAEYDTPQNLLAQEDSIFASLVRAGS